MNQLNLAELVNLFVFLLENKVGFTFIEEINVKSFITEHDVYMFGSKSF